MAASLLVKVPAAVVALMVSTSGTAWGQTLSEPTSGATQGAVVKAASARVHVQGFKVSGNTLLPSDRIDGVLASYLGDRTLDDLRQAALAVQGLYRDAGYGAVVAFLPEQDSPGGQVSINVIEGRVAKVVITGTRQFSEVNILASLPSLVGGQTPKVREIDSQIQLANENPAKQIEVLLQPGSRPGDVEARIKVAEQPLARYTVGLDNTGNEVTGRSRANFGYQHASLWGADHVLGLNLQLAPEDIRAVSVISANYRVPLYAAGMAVDVYAAYSDVDGGTNTTAAGAVQFAGKGRIAGMRISKYLPRLGEIDQRLVLGFDHRDYVNNCSIVGLDPGACGSAGESVSVQPVTIEYILQKGGQHPWGANVSLQRNLQIGGGHASDASFQRVRPGAEPDYTVLRLGLFGGSTFGEEWQLQARFVGQFTDDALVSGEQFGIGGASAVRGYDEREVTGDRGATVSIEVFTPDFGKRVGLSAGAVRLVGFADAGYVGNRLGTACRSNQSECSLASVGLGLRFALGGLQAKLDLAYALKAGNRTDRHDARAHFSVSHSF